MNYLLNYLMNYLMNYLLNYLMNYLMNYLSKELLIGSLTHWVVKSAAACTSAKLMGAAIAVTLHSLSTAPVKGESAVAEERLVLL